MSIVNQETYKNFAQNQNQNQMQNSQSNSSNSNSNSNAPTGSNIHIKSSPFDVKGKIILITGGGSGIGFGLTKELINLGAKTIIITGRREEILKEAKSKFPNHIVYYVNDAGKKEDREQLFESVKKDYPSCSVLINNAGIQRRAALAGDKDDWSKFEEEMEINLMAPIHLCRLFAPFFVKQNQTSAIINITSGLAFTPAIFAPVYSTSKAGLHQFTLCLRGDVDEKSDLRIVEIAPPAVKSNLGGSHDFGEDCDEFCKSALKRFVEGELEIGYKTSEFWRNAPREKTWESAVGMATHFKVPKYTR